MAFYEIYDKLSQEYDDRYQTEYDRKENEFVTNLIQDLVGESPRILDVGAGTGLTLELGITSPEKYWGIEPSALMSAKLLNKFSGVDNFFVGTYETFYRSMGLEQDFDLVISLFGSPSYINPMYLHLMLRKYKNVLLMNYIDGYRPDYEYGDEEVKKQTEAALREVNASAAELGAKKINLNKFQITIFGDYPNG